VSTKKNSKGACNQDAVSNAMTALRPFKVARSVSVAPRLKKPRNPAVKNENAESRRFSVVFDMGGVQLTLPIISGYTKERMTGTQLFKKIRIMTATRPKTEVALTGFMMREVIRTNRNA